MITTSGGNCIEEVHCKSEKSAAGDKSFDDGVCACAYLSGVFRSTCHRVFGNSEICLYILLYHYAVGQHCGHSIVWTTAHTRINKKNLTL